MSDLLLDLSQKPQFKRVVKTLGLPVPTPPMLARNPEGYTERPLAGEQVMLYSSESSPLAQAITDAVTSTGAEIVSASDFDAETKQRFKAIVFDAGAIESTADLDELYAFFHPLMRSISSSGRVLVVGLDPNHAETASQAAARQALEGFMRSVAKEIGKKGATSQLLWVAPDATDRLLGPVRFVLSPHSAYVNSQPLRVSASTDAPELSLTESLAGKTVLVTGAARGIGAATARRLAKEGARVVCLDLPHDQAKLTKVASEIGGDSLPLDLTSSQAPVRIAAFLKSKHGGVDVIVHNAGVTRDKTLARMREEQWNLALDVNLRAVEKVNTYLLENDVINEHGSIVCLSSIAGIAGNMGQTNYAAAKAGVIGYVRFMAKELAGKNIRINAVAPGFIETRMTDAMPAAVREVARRMNALSQGGRPIDVAEAITFFGSNNSHGLTGQVLRVCGGMMIGA